MTNEDPSSPDLHSILQRYKGADLQGLETVLCPLLVPMHSVDREILKLDGQSHYRGTFEAEITDASREVFVRGRTGKFVPRAYVEGTEPWREIAKGRIIDIDLEAQLVAGEIYLGSSARKQDLEEALTQLHDDDYLEIDQYGAAAKVLSGLVEHKLSRQLKDSGYRVWRMPEDMAKHLGVYANYDFVVEKGGVRKKIEVKSLWGTNTDYARLIHSLGKGYPTSSCKFETQDFFAVSLFLRTGDIRDFAFARSVSSEEQPHGLPPAKKYPEHVNQNPLCTIGDGSWFGSLDEVWNLA